MIHIIIGAPCSGKSTYVSEHRKAGDVVVDFDKLASAFGSDDSHEATDDIKAVTFTARDAAISEICERKCEAWIIHTKPTDAQREMYDAADAEYIEMDTDMQTCLERAERDGRPQRTFDGIRDYFGVPETPKGANTMSIKTKTYEVKAEGGTISGYASTWTREPDSYGDVVAKGAFLDCIEAIKAEGRVLPLLWNHDANDLNAYIGALTDLGEDDHGLKFEATFDETPEAQRARQLAMDGRLCKFSFAYDVLDAGPVTLEDGRKANELRKLNIHEVSLVMYPANPDTSVIEVKSGRRNSAKDEDKLRQAISLLQEVLGELDDTPDEPVETEAKSEEPSAVNDEEQMRKQALIAEATRLLTKEAN